MLTGEQARERLAAMRRAGAERAVGYGTANFAAAPLLAALGLDPSARPNVAAAAELTDGLSPRKRQAVFDAALPGLGRELEWMWQDGVRAPYQLGIERRAFRAPKHPEYSAASRFHRILAVVGCVAPYAHDGPAWVARWAPYIAWMGGGFGQFLAAVIDHGASGDEVMQILIDSADGEDEIGGMGQHVVAGLLGCSRPEAWDYVERLLLAAQRQEGLRQAIFEAVDEAHPDAFRRLLGVILEHDLVRFSSCARAVSVWLGLPQTAGDAPRLRRLLQAATSLLDDASARGAAIAAGSPEDAYLALCVQGWVDVQVALDAAAAEIDSATSRERRFALAWFIAQTRIPPAVAPMSAALADPELPIAAVAVRSLGAFGKAPAGTIDRIEALLDRLAGRPAELEPLVWPWTAGQLEPPEVAAELLRWTAKQPASRVIRHLGSMSPTQRASVARRLTAGDREAILALLGDPAATVREAAIRAAGGLELGDQDAIEIERLLNRKAGDLRRGAVALLLGRGPEKAAASAQRLLADRDPQRRAAGRELETQLGDAEARDSGSPAGEQTERPPRLASRADALGLVDLAALKPPRAPVLAPAMTIRTAAAEANLRSLDALVTAHGRDEVVRTGPIDGRESRHLFAELGRVISPLYAGRQRLLDLTVARSEIPATIAKLAAAQVPLLDVWRDWATARTERDPDGLELLRARLLPLSNPTRLRGPIAEMSEAACAALHGKGYDVVTVANTAAVPGILTWLTFLEAPPAAPSLLLDATEQMLASAPDEAFVARPLLVQGGPMMAPWRGQGWLLPLWLARSMRHLRPDVWTSAQLDRLWELERWVSRPARPTLAPGTVGVEPVPIEEMVSAFVGGAAKEADVLFGLIGPDERPPPSVLVHGAGWSRSLYTLTARTLPSVFGPAPGLAQLVDRARRRIVEVELDRGEAPTEAAGLAKALRYSGDLETLIGLVRGLGTETLVRGWSWQDSLGRKAIFSHLIRVSFPAEADTPEAFAEAARAAKLKRGRLLEVAAFAPQWARHVEAAVGWDGIADAVWWLHAHTKDVKWTVDPLIRNAWTAEVAERTPLTGPELLEGACDVDWWGRVHGRLGPERWRSLDAAAKYCSSSGGHKRAQLFSSAMAGDETVDGLISRIESSRHQDAVRALGLVPLGEDRTSDLLGRYEAIQAFIRTARQFGSQRQASEKRAAEIGLANLARTAGYPDPLRLEWAMEASRIADITSGEGARASADGVEVTLTIEPDGEPSITVMKAGKTLKSVPAAAKRDPSIKALTARVVDLRRQRSRMRRSLEAMMVRGDPLTGAELVELCGHPLLFAELRRLVLHGEGIRGFPMPGGRTLRGLGDTAQAVGHDELLRIAHPVELLAAGDWPQWQADLLARHERQPFKQLFRELYLLTQQERADRTFSSRYAGHQLQPRAATALLAGRGWVSHPEEGTRRTFHDVGVTASLAVLGGLGTPLELEAPTLEHVIFNRVGEFVPMPLTEVSPRVFSEVMRDVDLVVSVAHVGGVDPEATASTVEMRAALLTETIRLLGIDNVTVREPRALIDGRIGAYSVHLGSATVHKQPGGALCIVPVSSQHRGRVFLPFADDDPKTAEVIAKVLLLARDHEIKDPVILEQIRTG